ncbi:MAG: hypothetical protein HEQ23_02475 [Tepidisphaera sp.]
MPDVPPQLRNTRPRGLVRWLLVSLAAGALLTVAIAWACAWFSPEFPRAGTSARNGPAMYQGDIIGFNSIRLSFGVHRVLFYPWPGSSLKLPQGATLDLNQEHLPSWSLATPLEGDWNRDTANNGTSLIIEERGCGWPWTTLVGRSIATTHHEPELRRVEGIRIPTPPGTRLAFPKYLPTKPAWAGFASSTLILSIPISGPVLASWWIRRHRAAGNRCIGCGYSLSGLADGLCPECGPGPAAAKPAQSSALV